MICFNCDTFFPEEIPYRYNHEQIGFVEFFKKLSIGTCPTCNIIQIDHSLLDKNKLNTYYSIVYRSKAKLGLDSGNEYDKKYFTARATAQVKLIKKFLKNDIKNVFEFGSGYGYVLSEVSKCFPDAKLFTNEVDETITPLCKFKKYEPNLQYDLIILSHVLEHLDYPQRYLHDIVQKLNREGILFIEVPSETKNLANSKIHMEPHITFFTLNSLIDFIEKNFKEQLEVLYAGTAGLVSVIEPTRNNFFIRCIKSFLYRALRITRWVCHGGHDFPRFNFENNTKKNVWNNIRIVCRKRS